MNRKLYTFWIDADLLAGLKTLKQRSQITESDTIRAALRAWLGQHGALKAARKRADTRKRA